MFLRTILFPRTFDVNLCLEFEMVHQVLKIVKKLATSALFGRQLLEEAIVVSCIIDKAKGKFRLLFPGCNAWYDSFGAFLK